MKLVCSNNWHALTNASPTLISFVVDLLPQETSARLCEILRAG